MREILFRGKTNKGEWVYGWLGHPHCYNPQTKEIDSVYFTELREDLSGRLNVIVDYKTIGQYTGLTDKNGKKIFEGDICRFREWCNGDMCWIGKVHYEHQQFVISGGKNKECPTQFTVQMSRFIPENIEVIGNIHDNPELLGDK